jgi:hypothetical protein
LGKLRQSGLTPRQWNLIGALALLLAAVQAAKIAHGMQQGLVGVDLEPPLHAARPVG